MSVRRRAIKTRVQKAARVAQFRREFAVIVADIARRIAAQKAAQEAAKCPSIRE